MTAPGRFDTINVPPALVGVSDRFVFSRDAVRALDRAVIEEFGVPGVVLMENAAIGLAHVARAMLRIIGSDAVLILAGPGNNGGDGFALARHLATLGVNTHVAILFDPDSASGDAAVNLRIIRVMRLHVLDARAGDTNQTLEKAWRALGGRGLIVDAMLGTGATSPPRPPISDAIAWLNEARTIQPESAVLAVDLPSGLDCDTGTAITAEESPHAVIADATATLAGFKKGMLEPGSRRFTGRVFTLGIGAPLAAMESFGTPLSGAIGA